MVRVGGRCRGPRCAGGLELVRICSGDLGDGWAEAMLSKRFQISESLAEECEAVGEARPPRRVAEISDFQWCRDGNLC